MFDLSHAWSGDLANSTSGDIALVTGTSATSQRVYRRLMTDPSAYLWSLQYGAGLAAFVGSPVDSGIIESVVRNQMLLEPSVATDPQPIVKCAVTDTANGGVVVNISYSDAYSGTGAQLSMGITA